MKCSNLLTTMCLSSYILAALVMNAESSERVVRGAGYALQMRSDHFMSVEDTCGFAENPYLHPAYTLMTWFRTEPLDHPASTGTTNFLCGFPHRLGPSLFLDPEHGLKAVSYQEFEVEELVPDSIDFARGEWQHVALTMNITHVRMYLNGRKVYARSSSGIEPNDVGRQVLLGAFNEDPDSPDKQTLNGQLDNTFLFTEFMQADQIIRIMNSAEAAMDYVSIMLMGFNFDESGGTPVDLSGRHHRIEMGGGIKARSPTFVPSNAPVSGPTQVISVHQDERAGYFSNTSIDLIAEKLPRPVEADPIDAILRVVNVSIREPSRFFIKQANNTTKLAVAGSMYNGTEIIFQQSVGDIGIAIAFIVVDVIFAVNETTIRRRLQVDVVENNAPLAGNGGTAIDCDGINDFLMAKDFSWPKQQFSSTVGNETTLHNGSGPITVEFWAWIDESSAADGAVLSIGGSHEHDAGWVRSYSPNRSDGRFVITLPFTSGRINWWVRKSNHASNVESIESFYNTWTHWAFVSDMANGTEGAIFANGEELVRFEHDHNTFVQADHLTVCTWSFWSGVYHSGKIDELRIWNRARTKAEIRENMYSSGINGQQEGLAGYWDFNDIQTSGNGKISATDRTQNGNALVFGGCVPCEERFKCWIPTLGEQQCIPSAKNHGGLYYQGQLCFGGTHCFEGQERLDTHPAVEISGAPIGGTQTDVLTVSGVSVDILLNGTDIDGDRIYFWITTLPERGTLYHLTHVGDAVVQEWVEITSVPVQLQTPAIRFTSDPDTGGSPYTSFGYKVSDLVPSFSRESFVKVLVSCPPGKNLEQGECKECVAGTYSRFGGFGRCKPCPLNTFNDEPGQTGCRQCLKGQEFTDSDSSTSCRSCDTYGSLINVDSDDQQIVNIPVDASLCPLHLKFGDQSHQANPVAICDFGQIASPGELQAVVVTGLPRQGSLFQVSDGGDDRGMDLDTAFSSPTVVRSEFASTVISVSSSGEGHTANAILFEPDVPFGTEMSHENAWAPANLDAASPWVILQFSESMYVSTVVAYRSAGSGSVAEVHLLPEDRESNENAWELVFASSSSRHGDSSDEIRIDVCPTSFLSRRIRLTFVASLMDAVTEIDAVEIIGASSLENLDEIFITDSNFRLRYEPPNLQSIDQRSGYRFSDVINYRVIDCTGSTPDWTGFLELNVQLGDDLRPDQRKLCRDGFYRDENGDCQSCPMHARTYMIEATNRSQCQCGSGFYGHNGHTCTAYSEGGECLGGSPEVWPKPGWVPSFSSKYDFYKCLPSEACPAQPGTFDLDADIHGGFVCHEYHTGLNCGECVYGSGRSSTTQVCQPCQTLSGVTLSFLVVLGCLLSFVGILLYVRYTSSRANQHGALLTIVVEGFHTYAIFSMFSDYWPAPSIALLNISELMSIDLSSFSWSCALPGSSIFSRWLTQALSLPVIWIATLLTAVPISFGLEKGFPNLKHVSPIEMMETSAVGFRLAAPMLARHLLRPFDCTNEPDDSSFMVAAPSIRCFGQDWSSSFLPASIVLGIVLLAIVPVTLLVAMRHHRKLCKLEMKSSSNANEVRQPVASFTRSYKEPMWFWNFVLMARSFAFIMLMPFWRSNTISRVFVGMLVQLSIATLKLVFNPFKNSFDNHLDQMLTCNASVHMSLAYYFISERKENEGLFYFFNYLFTLTWCIGVVAGAMKRVQHARSPNRGRPSGGNRAGDEPLKNVQVGGFSPTLQQI